MLADRLKKLDTLDWVLSMLGAMAFILFIITVWPAAMELTHSIHWGWFLVATLILVARTKMKAWFK